MGLLLPHWELMVLYSMLVHFGQPCVNSGWCNWFWYFLCILKTQGYGCYSSTWN